jgi:hypothetical protein
MLMTKFGMSERTGLFGLVFRNIRFSQFQNMNRKGATLEDLRIPVHLRHGKRRINIKEPNGRNPS